MFFDDQMWHNTLSIEAAGKPMPVIVYEVRSRASGNIYIGVTSQPFERRQYQHFHDAFLGKSRGAFHHAIRKYGKDGFSWSVLKEFEARTEALAEEKRLIKALRPAYNSTKGGEGYAPRVVSKELRRFLSELHRGNTYRLGQTHTQKTRARLRVAGLRDKEKWAARSHLGPAAMAKPVICINTGVVFESASAAARAHHLNKAVVIEVCCRNPRRRSAGGKVFRYHGDHHDGGDALTSLQQAIRGQINRGYRGISRYIVNGVDTGRWRAAIQVNNRSKKLGIFSTPEEAHAAYVAAGGQA